MERRKVTFKLYPSEADAKRLRGWLCLHCELYNAALQERIEAYRKAGKSISYYDQQNTLPEIKATRPEFNALGSHALQQTLRRLDLAFQAFFRRVKSGETAGFPRFKASKRFDSFCYPDPAGWKLQEGAGRAATIRLGSGQDTMMLRARGQHRFGVEAKPNDLTVIRKNGGWYASITLRVPETACARQRTGEERRGVDFGITDWATFEDGQTIENPRWTREELPSLAALQQQRAKKKKGSLRYGRLTQRIARKHEPRDASAGHHRARIEACRGGHRDRCIGIGGAAGEGRGRIRIHLEGVVRRAAGILVDGERGAREDGRDDGVHRDVRARNNLADRECAGGGDGDRGAGVGRIRVDGGERRRRRNAVVRVGVERGYAEHVRLQGTGRAADATGAGATGGVTIVAREAGADADRRDVRNDRRIDERVRGVPDAELAHGLGVVDAQTEADGAADDVRAIRRGSGDILAEVVTAEERCAACEAVKDRGRGRGDLHGDSADGRRRVEGDRGTAKAVGRKKAECDVAAALAHDFGDRCANGIAVDDDGAS